MHEIASRRYISPYHLALVNCSLGRAEQTLDLLDQAHESRDGKCYGWPWILSWTCFMDIGDSGELLAKLNHRLSRNLRYRISQQGIRNRSQPLPPTPVNGNTASAFAIPAPQPWTMQSRRHGSCTPLAVTTRRVARQRVFGGQSTASSMQLN